MKRSIPGALAACAVALLLCGASCNERETPQPAPALPKVEGLGPRVILVRPGETVSLSARMTDPDGAPFEPYSFAWRAQIRRSGGGLDVAPDEAHLCDSSSVVAAPETGVRTLSFPAMQRGICMIEARVTTCGGITGQPCIDTQTAELGPVYVQVAGGQTDLVVPLHPSVTLVVGETRSLAAVPMLARDEKGHRDPSGESWSLRAIDTSVAVVEGEQKVRAVAPGSTEIEFSSGVARARVPLTVREGAPGPPPDGRHRLETVHFAGVAPDSTDIRGEPVFLRNPFFSSKHRLALDPQGAPSAVFETTAVEVEWAGLVLAEWSGSGFGLQTVGPWEEQLLQPQLAIDEHGLRYVAFQSRKVQRALVATRAADAGTDGWTLRELPRRIALSAGEEQPSTWAFEVDADFDREPFAVMARPGGGAWIAYVVWNHDAADPLEPCVRTLRLATVSETGLAAEDLEVLRFEEYEGGCEKTAKMKDLEVAELHLLPTSGASMPRVLLLERKLNSSFSYPKVFERLSGSWSKAEWPMGVLPNRSESLPHQAAVARPTPADAGATALWSSHVRETSDVLDFAFFGPGFSEGPYEKCFCDEGDPGELFALQARGSVWLGDGNLGPLIKFTEQGRVVMDDPSPLLLSEERDSLESVGMEELLGWDSDGERLTVLSRHSGNRLDLLTVTSPAPARDGADDRQGARLGDLITDVPLRLTPYALPSGAVMLNAGARQKSPLEGLSDGSSDTLSGLWRSDSSGSPWAKFSEPVPLSWWSAPTAFFELDGALFGMQIEQGTSSHEIVRSTDGGLSWNDPRAVGSSVARTALVGRTLFLVTHQPVAGADGGRPTELGLFRLADLGAADGQAQELGARVAVPGVRYAEADERLALLAEPEGVVAISELDPDPHLGRLSLRRLGRDGAELDAHVTGERGYLNLDLRTAVRAGEGSLVAFRRDSSTNGFAIVAHRSGDLFRTEEQVRLEGEWWEPLQAVTLEDGRIVVAAGRWLGPQRVQAAYCVSSDGGRTWSAPRALRPEGGQGQRLWGLAGTAEGGLLAVMGDSGLMRANRDQPQVVDAVVVRIEAP